MKVSNQITLFLCMLILLVNCSAPEEEPVFETIACAAPDSTVAGPNKHNIFKACRQYLYRAQYFADTVLISDEEILLLNTAKQFGYYRDKHSGVIVQYKFRKSDEKRIKSDFFVEDGFKSRPWVRKDTIGIIESNSKTWMQALDANQYLFTQMAPLPEVIVPVQTGMSWSNKRKIREGYGEWNGAEISSLYQVMEQDSIVVANKKVNAWRISSNSQADVGPSRNDYWYSDEYGFVKMDIVNYKGQTLKIELKEVIEP